MKLIPLLMLSLVGCVTTPPVVPDDKPQPALSCASMCDHLRELGCLAGRPTPKGITCEVTCANVQDSGVIDLDLQCLTTAPSCTAADTCGAPPPVTGTGSGG